MLEFFPVTSPREKQSKAIDFVSKAIERGFKHIVIAAATGMGKTLLGATTCLWASSQDASSLSGEPGGYYLVMQKLLQDQLEHDFVDNPQYECVSLKSASNYECDNPAYKNCELGKHKKCACTKYSPLREAFITSKIGVTNYAYFITERINLGKLPRRRVLILDECANLARTLVRFFDITVGPSELDDVEVIEDIPQFRDIHEFILWCRSTYKPRLLEKATAMMNLVMDNGPEYFEKANKLVMQLQKLTRAINSMVANPKAWIFWSQKADKSEELQYIARPLYAHEFTNVLFDAADLIIHMSAFPGDKQTYCKLLGLNPEEVAWASFTSTFPVENRPIKILSVGSMSMKNIDSTMPRIIDTTKKILEKNSEKKGLLHVNSYKIGHAIYNALIKTPHGLRLIFPKTADEREEAFSRHANSKMPTVIISPSMTEGFDFAGKLAEFQIIAKMPFLNLADKHVAASKNADDDWYIMETVKTIVQACGRIVRSDTDVGTTYILDSDINRLLDQYGHFFPKWWTAAVIRR